MDNIFALNNQVFGSKFREMRVSSRTRKRVGSELIIPDSAVEMTYSDMCEVNGGSNGMPSFVISGIINGLLCLVPAIGAGMAGITGLIKWGFKQSAKSLLKQLLPWTVGIMYGLLGLGIIAMTNDETDAIVNIVMGCFNGVGGVIALAIDYTSDGKFDGWISF